MTDEELARFALQLREAERVRAQIAKDEAAARVGGSSTPPPPVSPPAMDHSSGPAVVAA
jgi:hypothetical protein